MEKYMPDIYQKNIYTINYKKLYETGIKCLLFDLDNTLVSTKVKNVTKRVKELIDELKKQGFKVVIFSNCLKNRIKPFKDELDIDCFHLSCKPYKRKFLKLLKIYNYTVNEVAIIGDQLLTDILGGNKVGITTILVNPISKRENFLTKINRFKEKSIYKKLKKNNLFSKGRYYE